MLVGVHPNPCAVGPFFKDLTNPAYATPFAIYHRRFSTNTTPKWPLAQPMRVLGHNGALELGCGALRWVGGVGSMGWGRVAWVSSAAAAVQPRAAGRTCPSLAVPC